MKIRLGYACTPLKINKTTSHIVTYSYFKKLENLGFEHLNLVIIKNLTDLKEILKYNIKNNIHFFRISSSLIPLATHDLVTFEYLKRYNTNYLSLGKIISKAKMRIDMHPDQFVVLNSVNDKVVLKSIETLKYLSNILISLKIKTPLLILHVGSSKNGKAASMKRFISNFNKLDSLIKQMIILENDDKIYNVRNVLKLCKKINVPFVLDYHHYKCNNNNLRIEDYIVEIFKTWDNKNIVPKVHFSTSKNKTKRDFRSHNDYIKAKDFIKFIDKIKFCDRDFDVMIEAKKKDLALVQLVEDLKKLTNYEWIDETTFLVR